MVITLCLLMAKLSKQNQKAKEPLHPSNRPVEETVCSNGKELAKNQKKERRCCRKPSVRRKGTQHYTVAKPNDVGKKERNVIVTKPKDWGKVTMHLTSG
jgi:hypothetical protein